MNHFHHPDGERHQTASLSQNEKAEGFAEVMKRLKNSSEPERGQLRAQADAAILGHEAYALGYDNFRRGNHVAAKRWLRVAADHSVPGAEEALEEIEAGPASPVLPEPPPVEIAVDTEPCPRGDSRPVSEDFAGLSSLLQDWAKASLTMDVARGKAREMAEHAREAAEKLIAETRQDVERARADAWEEIAAQHRLVAELLREAEELQRGARLLLQKTHCEAKEPTGKGQLLERLFGDDVVQAAQAKTICNRGQNSAPDGEQQPPPTRAKNRTTVRTLTASGHVETGIPLTLAMTQPLAMTQRLEGVRRGTWRALSRDLFEVFRQVLDETAECFTDSRRDASLSGQFLMLGTNSNVGLDSWIQRVPLRLEADWCLEGSRALNLSDGAARFAIACWNAHAETWFTCSLRGNFMHRIFIENEVASATPDPEHRRNAVHLKIYWMADGYVEAEESSTATDVVDTHEAAPVTPR